MMTSELTAPLVTFLASEALARFARDPCSLPIIVKRFINGRYKRQLIFNGLSERLNAALVVRIAQGVIALKASVAYLQLSARGCDDYQTIT